MHEVVPRKIVFFLSTMNCGGAERVALLLSAAMADLGCQVYLVLARREGSFLEYVSKSVEIISLDCGKPIKGVFEFGRVIRRLRPDAVISFGIHAGIASAFSKSWCRFPQPLLVRNESNIAVEWRRDRFHNSVVGPLLSRWMARKSTVICVSHALRKPTADFLRTRLDQVEVVLNPVFPITEVCDEAEIHPWLLRKSCPTFIAMGRLEEPKDFVTLLRAFRLVLDEIPCKLVIFGEGALRGALGDLCTELDMNASVDFPGVTRSPSLQMRSATGFVLSSRWEGFGLVLVEALAAGAAVIATDCDFGPAEILDGGRYGALVPVQDEAALAKAIIDLAKDRNACARPGAEWYAQFDARIAALKHLEVVEKAIIR